MYLLTKRDSTLKTARPFRLAPFFSPRPWGGKDWTSWYAGKNFPEPVGEAWLTGPTASSKPAIGPAVASPMSQQQNAAQILGSNARAGRVSASAQAPRAKGEALPAGASRRCFAQQKGYPRGKTECWYVLDAAPGATIALGMKEGIGRHRRAQRRRRAPTMEDLMIWLPVHRGRDDLRRRRHRPRHRSERYPARNQQTCDITYRLYDYGRPPRAPRRRRPPRHDAAHPRRPR